MEPGITWYDVLDVLPGADPAKIRREYKAKTNLLRPELVSGAPSNVVQAISLAQGMLDSAREVLADPVSRERYDESIGGRVDRRAFVSRFGPARIEDVAEPPLPAADWIRVQTTFSGLCGSDVKQILLNGSRDNPLTALVSFPHVLGHEVVGRRLDNGEQVVLNPWLSCVPRGIDPPCVACRDGALAFAVIALLRFLYPDTEVWAVTRPGERARLASRLGAHAVFSSVPNVLVAEVARRCWR